MTRFVRALAAAVGVVLLGSIVALVPQKNVSGAPGPAPVTVTNTPLPVSGNVTVTNTPLPVSGSVSASQSGMWSVAVNNLPPTQSVSFNSAQPVSFSNTLTTPLFNSDRDNPARQPVTGGCGFFNVIPTGDFMTCSLLLNTESAVTLTAVPAGQRLVIETITGLADMPTGAIPERFILSTVIGTSSTNFFIAPQKVGAENSAVDGYVATEPVRLYADPGTAPQFSFLPNTTQQISASITISGYLVNIP